MPESQPSHRRFVIDTDIGTDDAVAIVLALRSESGRAESGQVAALTTVFGNTNVDQVVRNARYVLELCQSQARLYRGAGHSIDERRQRRDAVHGHDGLGDLGLRPRRPDADAGVAADQLIQLSGDPPLTLVTLGPLTNVALALRRAPQLASVLGEIIVMGGAIDRALPAEFNLRSDPRAAQEALSSGAAITLVPIDLSLGEAAHTPADCEKLEAIGTPQAEFVLSMCYAGMRTRNVVGLPDAIAMAIALDRSLIRRSNPYIIEVGNDGEIALQPAVVVNQEPSVEVVEEIDAERYKAVLRNACL